MSSFKSSRKIVLLPNDNKISFTFQITECSSAVSNDGFRPFGIDVTSVIATCVTEDGTAVSSIFTTPTPSVASNVITVTLKYPTEGEGRYYLTFVMGMSNGSQMAADFQRVFAEV